MATTHQPLALRADAPLAFGSRDELKALADRIRVMLPSAHLADWQMERKDRAELQKVLDESVFRAAQLCVFYRLVPGEDVHVIPFGNNWAVDMGIETWKKSADRYCAQHGITYHIVTEEMPVEELRERRGEHYHPDDYGMVAYLWRSDKRDVYEIFGAKQSMSRAAGIWAKKAKFNKGKNEWQEDNIPTQRSKQDVAKRRAMKAVLKLEFSLDSLLAATPAEVQSNMDAVKLTVAAEERRGQIMQRPQAEYDLDGFPVKQSPPQKWVVVGDNGEVEPDVDEIAEQESSAESEDSMNFDALRAKLTGSEASFVTWAKNTHLNSSGPASVEQYRYLVGTLNAIAGDKEAYRLLLGVLFGRHVDSDNRPGINAAAKLLDWLVKEHTDEVTGEKIASPQYRQDYVDCVKAIYVAVTSGK